MRKAVLSNRIYLEKPTSDELDQIRGELKYVIRTKAGNVTRSETINNFSMVSPIVCSIPSGRMDLVATDYEVIDKRVVIPVQFPQFGGTLRPSQQEVYDQVNDSCMINAPVSYGKTFTALAIAAKLGQKTLVVTHTTMLRDQWIEEIEKIFGIEAGIVGTGKFITNSIIVVGNVQTVTKRMADLADMFGTVIVDECHHTSASTFSSIVDKSKARYKIGLSGTITRKDMKHVVFNDYFGFHVLKPEKENCMLPQVVVVESNIKFPLGKHWANKVTQLENETPEYRQLVVELAIGAASKGYKVLVVASRVEFLTWAAQQVPKAASITGAVKDIKERTAILNKIGTGELDVIFGTMSIFSEGISQNDLSCLILATPTNNEPMLTQLIGRIIRESPGKKQPLILDISLKGSTVKGQSAMRLGHYLKSGYQVRVLKK